jgi:hypothetical protein
MNYRSIPSVARISHRFLLNGLKKIAVNRMCKSAENDAFGQCGSAETSKLQARDAALSPRATRLRAQARARRGSCSALPRIASRICEITGLALFFCLLPSLCAAASGFSLSTLQDLPGVGISVKRMQTDAERLGLSEEGLKFLMERRLNDGGVPVFADSKASDMPGAPMLEVGILVRKMEGESTYLFTVRLALQEMVVLDRPTQNLASFYAPTWEKAVLGITNKKGYVEAAVGQLIARFVREYKEENGE